MIKLSKIKILKRAMLSVLSLVFLLGGAFFAAKMVKTFHVNATEGDEDVGAGSKQVYVSIDTAHGYPNSGGQIYYGHGDGTEDYFTTRYYSVTYTGFGGKTYLSYCVEPQQDVPETGAEHPYNVNELAAPGSTDANYNAIKLLIYLSNTSIAGQTTPVDSVSIMNELYSGIESRSGITAADTRYAFVHATAGYLYPSEYGGEAALIGLTDAEKTKIRSIANLLESALEERATDDPSYIALHKAWLIAQNATLNTIATNTQHMVWVEPEFQSANIEVKKCNSTGTICSGEEFDDVTFKLYNNSGRVIYAADIGGGTFFNNGDLMLEATISGGSGKVLFEHLPLGVNYRVEESGTNYYYILTPPTSQEITLDRNGGTGHLTFKNKGVSLGTMATDAADGDKFLQADAESIIKDTVEYCVVPGQEYTIKGVLMDKSTGEKLLVNGEPVTSEATINPTSAADQCGTAEMLFKFDSSELGGKDLVVFETLYLDTEVITSHEEIDDEGQTIRVVSLGTTATDGSDGDKTIIAGKNAVITDRIEYCLVAGTEYTLVGTLVNKATGEYIEINGETITQSIIFVPEEDCGEVDMTFEFDATGLGGTDIVVFETAMVLDPDTETYDTIASHEDLDDEGQTIKIVDKAPETGFFTGSASSDDASGLNIPMIIAISASVFGVVAYLTTRATAKRRFFGRR